MHARTLARARMEPAITHFVLWFNSQLGEGDKDKRITVEQLLDGEGPAELTEEQKELMMEEGIIPNFNAEAFKSSLRGTPHDPNHRADDDSCSCDWCLISKSPRST